MTQLARTFVHTLVPIAAVYVIAHYFSFLAYNGQAIVYLASDPLGKGWDLFGTADRAIDYGVISATGIWYVQVGVLVLGHVGGLVLAHDRALALYAKARDADPVAVLDARRDGRASRPSACGCSRRRTNDCARVARSYRRTLVTLAALLATCSSTW